MLDSPSFVSGTLEAAGEFTATFDGASGTADEGRYGNTGSVVAFGPPTVGPDGEEVPPEQVGDDDPSHYNAPVTAHSSRHDELASTGRLIGSILLAALVVILVGMILFLKAPRRSREG